MNGAILLMGAGAAALALTGDDGVVDPQPTGQVVGSRPVPRQFTAQGTINRVRNAYDVVINGGKNRGNSGSVNPQISDGGGNWYKGADAAEQAILKEVERRAQAEYDKLSRQAKKEGAAIINEELGTDLTGDESFKEASNKIGAAVGAVGAGAVCGAFSVGAAAPVCAIIGSIVGAYLGETVGQWCKEAWESISDWAEDGYEAVEDWIKSLP